MSRPRVGFLGVGWIGRNRMEALAQSGLVEIVAVSDPVAENADAAAKLSGRCDTCESLDQLLETHLDGLVIATPSALHADQAITALERGVAVFCQKPLGRTAAETSDVVAAARAADRLLGVDLSYRFVRGIALIRDLIHNGDLGTVYSADLVFHNAYGPDKPWFYDAVLSGGGCVIDLGSHLVDLALWKPDPDTKEFTVVSLHPGVSRDKVQDTCGWKVRFCERVEETPPPTEIELSTLRDLQARTERAHGGAKGA